MKNYTITVNGTAYDVVVEERDGGAAPAAASAPVKDTPKSQAQAGAGAVKVTASVPGKVFKLEAKVGQAVKAGDTIVILEDGDPCGGPPGRHGGQCGGVCRRCGGKRRYPGIHELEWEVAKCRMLQKLCLTCSNRLRFLTYPWEIIL